MEAQLSMKDKLKQNKAADQEVRDSHRKTIFQLADEASEWESDYEDQEQQETEDEEQPPVVADANKDNSKKEKETEEKATKKITMMTNF